MGRLCKHGIKQMTFNATLEGVISRLTDESQYEFCDRLFRRLKVRTVKDIPSLFFLLDGCAIMQLTDGRLFIEPIIWDHLNSILKKHHSNPYERFDGAISSIKGAIKDIFGLGTIYNITLNSFAGTEIQDWI